MIDRMGPPWTAAALVGVVALATLAGAGEGDAEPPVGLALVATTSTTTTLQEGQSPELRVRLVNRADDVAHPVVTPGDGSDAGWREPHVWWSAAYVNSDGTERSLTPLRPIRCKQFDREWWDDVVELAPGGEVAVDWWTPLSASFEFREAGTVRLRVHSRWSGGAPAPDAGVVLSDAARRLVGTPSYELVSAPVDVRYVRPMDVELSIRSPARVGVPIRDAELLAAHVVGRGDETARVPLDGWTVSIELGGAPSVEVREYEIKRRGPRPDVVTLEPGARHELLHGWRFGAASEFDFTFREAGTARARVVLASSTAGGPRLTSPWVTVTVDGDRRN